MDEKTRVGYKHVTIQRHRDRDHINPRSDHVMSQAYDPVKIGGLRLVHYSRAGVEKKNCHAHRITNAVLNILTGSASSMVYPCYLLRGSRVRAEWICPSRGAKHGRNGLPERRGGRD